MKKSYFFLIAGVFILFFGACNSGKKEPEKKPVKKTVVHQPLVDSTKLADSLARVAEQKAQEEKMKKAKPDDKFFLIAGSFKSKENAEKFKDELISKGYDARVVVRKTGRNTEFYRVSYRAFYDRKKAFKELKQERSTEPNDSVWLLIR